MKTASELVNTLKRIDGRSYPAYRDLKGTWKFQDFILSIDHVQADPFASPSDLSVRIEHPGFPSFLYETALCRIALQDWLLRQFRQAVSFNDRKDFHTSKGGRIECAKVSQQVLERSACRIDPDTGQLTVRFHLGFPAAGRKILAGKLKTVLFGTLVKTVRETLFYDHLSAEQKDSLRKTYELTCDQQEIRRQLAAHNLAAFVADGSILPRKSGVSDLPMEEAVSFCSPESMRIALDLPYAGTISGMAVPEGITVIAGGGYHGKSTLLEALEKGIWNHIKGDGREFVITREDAVKIRSEDGRYVDDLDISAFIRSLPSHKSVTHFSSEDASGSTSQAANVLEAIESGSRLFLIDEDTSATNFMVRDELMASVISPKDEPIIPFLSRLKELKDRGISVIVTMGSSGSFFHAADQILQMDQYEPYDITAKAHEAALTYGQTVREADVPLAQPSARFIHPDPDMRSGRTRIKTSGTDTLLFGREAIDTRALEQLIDSQQLAQIGHLMDYAFRHLPLDQLTFEQTADRLICWQNQNGPAAAGRGDLAAVRKQELMAAMTRMRSLHFSQQSEPETGNSLTENKTEQ